MILEKQIGEGPTPIDFGTEKPKYAALRTQIQAYFEDLVGPLEVMKQQVTLLSGLQALAEETEGAFVLSTAQRAAINKAVEEFLTQIAGPVRTREGFVAGGLESDTPDGVIQQRNVLAYAVGLQRGARLLDTDTTLTAGRQTPAVQAMLDKAFTRLSVAGEMRLEGVKAEVQGVLVSATEAGLNPFDTSRQLEKYFGLQKNHARVIARTEASFAAIEGSRNQMADLGVAGVEWLIDASACSQCQARMGHVYAIDDTENHPPEHPNCLCDLSPSFLPIEQ